MKHKIAIVWRGIDTREFDRSGSSLRAVLEESGDETLVLPSRYLTEDAGKLVPEEAEA